MVSKLTKFVNNRLLDLICVVLSFYFHFTGYKGRSIVPVN